jgi:hypothetical protein
MGDCNERAIYEAPDGKILIGTTQGVIIYDREKDRKSGLAPQNNINSVIINDVVYPFRETYSLPYRKRYVVKVNYTGIDFSEPEKVYYSTYLENYDDDWTAPSPSRESVYNLSDGKYRFNLVSVIEDGITRRIRLFSYQHQEAGMADLVVPPVPAGPVGRSGYSHNTREGKSSPQAPGIPRIGTCCQDSGYYEAKIRT